MFGNERRCIKRWLDGVAKMVEVKAGECQVAVDEIAMSVVAPKVEKVVVKVEEEVKAKGGKVKNC